MFWGSLRYSRFLVLQMKKLIYMDNAATTKVNPEVLECMLPFLKEEFGNPSTIYGIGKKAREAVEEARSKVAKFLGADA